MTTTLEERFKRLLLAANVLLDNHMDLGDCYVHNDNDDDYPTDSDGDRWYHDWWELREAINECESDEIGTTPAMPEITRQAFDEATGRANATLLAAAPDMLKALRECITDEGSVAYKNNDPEKLRRRLRYITKIVIQQIARATGE